MTTHQGSFLCLAITGFDSLTASPGVSASNGSFASILSAATVTNVGGGAANLGRSFTVDFGTIDNANSSNGVDETITLVYRAVPINGSSCARGNGRNNNAVLTWNSTSQVSVAASNVIIQEPSVTTTKSYPVAGTDADDLTTIQLVITAPSGTNNSPAYEVVATDNLNTTNFTYVGNIVHTAGVAPTTSGESGGIVTFTYDQLNPGESSTVRFDVRIQDSVQANSVQPNTASTTYTSMPGTPAGLDTYNTLACERTGSALDCGIAENDYVSNSTANLTIANVVNTKSIVTTSEGHTTGSGVAVGEIVRYRLVSRIPEGTQTNYVLRDAIPNGMSYLNDGTTQAAFVYNNSFASTTLTDPSLSVIGDEATIASVTPTYVLTGGAISAGANGNGTDVDFNFGTITNDDDDSNFEYIVVELNALIRNEATNTRGSVLNNTFSSRINGAAISGTTSASSSVTVQEPLISISKTVTTAPVDAGDNVAYTIVITNTAGANVSTGYEWVFADTLNEHLLFSSISDVTFPGYAALDSSATAGQDVSVTVTQLNPGDSATFQINAIVRDSAPANFIVPNTGNILTSSLPGTNGTTVNATGSSTPGASASSTGEETYTGNSSANTTLGAPSIDKQSPVAGTEYSIGETVTYPIVVSVPEGVVTNAFLTDFMPVGLRYESHSVDTTGFSGSFVNDPPSLLLPAVVPGGSGDDVVLDFGTINTPGTSGVGDSFTVYITARVVDIASNYDGQTLSNEARLTYTNPNTFLPAIASDAPVDITIREPRISVSKSLSGSGTRQIGNTLAYTVTITSDGSTTAYEWTMEDTLPDHTTLSAAPTCTYDGSPYAVTTNVASGVLSLQPNPLANSSLGVGESVTCTYELTIEATAVAGTTYTNTVDIDWRNAPASSGFSRHYNDSIVIPFDGSQDTDSASYDMESIAISKSDDGVTSAEVGRVIDYTLTIQAPNAVLDVFTVEDTLPEGMIYNNDATVTGTGSVVPTVTSPNDGTAPVVLFWDFGTVSHDGTTITIEYSARVANVAASTDGAVFTNTAELSFTPEFSAPQTSTDSDSFTINEPLLTLTKSALNPSVRLGAEQTFTLDVAHDPSSTNHANDLTIVDTLPAGVSYVENSAVLPGGWTLSVNANELTFTTTALSFGGSVQITYDVVVAVPPSAPTLGDVLQNSAVLTWTSLGGDVLGERTGQGGVDDYSAADVASFTAVGVDLQLSKSDQLAGAPSLPGDTITYELTYENIGNADATDVTITETVSGNTTFDAGNSSVGWTCADGAEAGTECSFSIGLVASSTSNSVYFAVTLVDTESFEREATTVDNTAIIGTTESDGPDSNSSNNTAMTTTDLSIADVVITKTDTIDPVFLDHDYSYIITVTNEGPDTATNLLIEDILPEGVSYRGYTAPNAICSYAEPSFTCTLTLLADGDQEIITLDVTGDTPGNKLNTVSVSHDQQDPNLLNNTDTENTFVDPADLVVLQSADKDRVYLDDIVRFTIIVRNDGPDTATNVVLTQNFSPDNFTILRYTSTHGSCSGEFQCSLGTLLPGEQAEIVIEARARATGDTQSIASAVLSEYDPNPDNSTDITVNVLVSEKLVSTGTSTLLFLLAGSSTVTGALALSRLRRRNVASAN